MDKEKLKKIVDNPRIIAGIHNYCDRWCERCPKTSCCSVWAMEQADTSGPESRDPENEAFWNRLHGIFSTTMEMVQEFAEKNGIDLNRPATEEEKAEGVRFDTKTREYPIVRAAMSYLKSARAWCNSANDLLKQKVSEAETHLRLGLCDTAPETELKELREAVEVVCWYYAQIGVKLRRAVRQMLQPPELDEDIPSDSDGSAKVALIGMDRSLAAWALMLKSFPEQEKDILDFLVRLERLRRETERTFPKARAFLRPGFDGTE